jgi:hypothetical protein
METDDQRQEHVNMHDFRSYSETNGLGVFLTPMNLRGLRDVGACQVAMSGPNDSSHCTIAFPPLVYETLKFHDSYSSYNP